MNKKVEELYNYLISELGSSQVDLLDELILEIKKIYEKQTKKS